jgi:hypothetical protein
MRAAACALVLGVSLAACGPIQYVNTVTRGASSALDEARSANADKLSPYWWTRAVEYLHQARVLAAHSDFQAANRFGRLARDAAQKARDEALAGGAPPNPMAKPKPGEGAAPDGTAPDGAAPEAPKPEAPKPADTPAGETPTSETATPGAKP